VIIWYIYLSRRPFTFILEKIVSNFILQKQWNWLPSGIALGIAFLLCVALVKPIGVSTQFVILDGIFWDAISDEVVVESSSNKSGYSSPNPYLNKSGGKYAKNVANPMNYSFVFVLAMVLGGFVASRIGSGKDDTKSRPIPKVWNDRFGDSVSKRYIATFLGGILVLYGSRLAGGCTSGHMMSGMMQTSLSGYLFALGAFAMAIPVALFLYKGVK